jgi:hypothetical protein
MSHHEDEGNLHRPFMSRSRWEQLLRLSTTILAKTILDFCRVCRGPSQPDQLLFHPCKCSGSMKFVHQDCLEQWLQHSNKKHCEICGHKFDFSPIYAHERHDPPHLTLTMLLRAIWSRVVSWDNPFIRVPLALFAWLVALPWAVVWVWRSVFDMPGVIEAFSHSGFHDVLFGRADIPDDVSFVLDSVNQTLSTIEVDRISWRQFWLLFLPDVLQGHVISLACVCFGLALLCLKEYIVMHTPLDGNGRPMIPEPVEPARPIVQPEPRLAPPAAHQNIRAAPRNIHLLESGSDSDSDSDFDGRFRRFRDGGVPEDYQERIREVELGAERGPERDLIPDQIPQPRNQPIPQPIPQPIIDEMQDEQNILPLLQLLGIHGPPSYLLFHPAFTFSMITIIIFFLTWWPSIIGRWAGVFGTVIKRIEGNVVDPIAFWVANLVKSSLPTNVTTDIVENVQNEPLNSSKNDTMGFTYYPVYNHDSPTSLMARRHEIATNVMHGWIVLIIALFVHSRVYGWNNHPYLHTFWRLFKGAVEWVGNVLKFVVFLGIELFFFPTLCGSLVSVFLEMWMSVPKQAVIEYAVANQWMTRFMVWLLGTFFMFSFASFVGSVKSHVRAGVMYFLRDPQDPEFAPMRDIIENGWFDQARKLMLSAIMYSCLVITVVGGITGIHWLWDVSFGQWLNHVTGTDIFRILPLKTTETRLLQGVPVDYLVLYFVVSGLLKHFDVLNAMDEAVKILLKRMAKVLRMSEYLFGTSVVSEHALNDLTYRVPNRDYIPLKRGDAILVEWVKGEALRGREGETDAEVVSNWRLCRVPNWFKHRLWAIVFGLLCVIIVASFGVIGVPRTYLCKLANFGQ